MDNLNSNLNKEIIRVLEQQNKLLKTTSKCMINMCQQLLFDCSESVSQLTNTMKILSAESIYILSKPVSIEIKSACIDVYKDVLKSTNNLGYSISESDEIKSSSKSIEDTLKYKKHLSLADVLAIISLLITIFTFIKDLIPNNDIKNLIETNKEQIESYKETNEKLDELINQVNKLIELEINESQSNK